ncbi:UbiA family prenyltransferase [Patescibacteria group bacterium]|nr:UbiA family prenyltransferase [Patescibacteria group bacterium]
MKHLMILVRLIRLNEWIDKIWLFFIAFIFLQTILGSKYLYKEFLVMIIFLFFSFSFTFLINSYKERDIDKVVGKDRAMLKVTEKFVILLIIIFGLISFFIPFYFNNMYITALNIFILLLAYFYSTKPLYLKSCPISGVVVAGMIQGPLAYMFFLFIAPDYITQILFITLWILVINIYMQLIHQIIDYKNDIITNMNTLAVKINKHNTIILSYFFMALMIFFLVLPFYLINNFYIAAFGSLLFLLYYLPSFACHPSFKVFE